MKILLIRQLFIPFFFILVFCGQCGSTKEDTKPASYSSNDKNNVNKNNVNKNNVNKNNVNKNNVNKNNVNKNNVNKNNVNKNNLNKNNVNKNNVNGNFVSPSLSSSSLPKAPSKHQSTKNDKLFLYDIQIENQARQKSDKNRLIVNHLKNRVERFKKTEIQLSGFINKLSSFGDLTMDQTDTLTTDFTSLILDPGDKRLKQKKENLIKQIDSTRIKEDEKKSLKEIVTSFIGEKEQKDALRKIVENLTGLGSDKIKELKGLVNSLDGTERKKDHLKKVLDDLMK